MRMTELVLTGLLVMVVFVCGCALDMSSEQRKQSDKHKEIRCEEEIEITEDSPIVLTLNSSESGWVLIRHDDGDYYVIEVRSAKAKKVIGIGQK